ncbi:hypothetical protein KKF91_13490, partial [Myxococcota bacterium]|nr:hypothetical protein [Myxococcota bacterium]
PAHPEALRMMEEIRQDEEATRRANPKTLRQVREETAQAKAYYQEARFREAHAELERAWRRDVPRRLKNQAKDRARWLQALHGHWLALARAEARGEGEAAISALEAALDLDGRLWGAHTAKLQARLNAQLYRQGYWAFKDARYVEAGEAARRILKASPKHPEARALLDAVEARAAQLFAAAQSNEISAPERARRLAVEAQRIGGEGSAVYGQAAALLARLTAP